MEDTVTSARASSLDSLTAEQQAFVKKFSIGGLLLSQVHFFATNLIRDAFLMFIPLYNIYVWLRGSFKGRQRSWETGEWKSFESFERRQKLMDKAALIVLAAIIGFNILIFVLMFGIFSLVSSPDSVQEPSATSSQTQGPSYRP